MPYVFGLRMAVHACPRRTIGSHGVANRGRAMGTRGGSGITVNRRALTSFVGRRQELARLRTLLSERRLVTITGPGGAGKTRLAEELVAALSRSLEGGVAFAYLAAAQGKT